MNRRAGKCSVFVFPTWRSSWTVLEHCAKTRSRQAGGGRLVDSGTDSDQSSVSKNDRLVTFTLEDRADVVVEFASEKSRESDRTHKWVEYARTGISTYVIVDGSDADPVKK